MKYFPLKIGQRVRIGKTEHIGTVVGTGTILRDCATERDQRFLNITPQILVQLDRGDYLGVEAGKGSVLPGFAAAWTPDKHIHVSILSVHQDSLTVIE